MTFRILAAALEQSDGLPPDAFGVALLDPVTGESLFGDLGGLDLSDAILNLQADGTVYLAPGVIMSGDPLSGEVLVTVSLAGADTSNGVLLSFDLIGQGGLASSIAIDAISFGEAVNTPPVARDDQISVDEDGTVAIDMLANDADIDGDPLSVTILTGPINGTLTPPADPDGSWVYTPAPDFFGTDSFTYSVTDGVNAPSTATVSITVNPVNDTPVLQPVDSRSASESEAVSIQLVASDADDGADTLAYTLVSGPSGATVSADGLVQWTAAGVGDQAFTVRVTDPGGAFSEQSFTICVLGVPKIGRAHV